MSGTATVRPARPHGRPAITFTWYDLLFLHWRVDVEDIRRLIPQGMEIDTFDGWAWIGLVPFSMREIRLRRCPTPRAMRAFPECNVRTYVRPRAIDDERFRDEHNGDRFPPGVWFFSLDAMCRPVVFIARRLWHLNYQFAQISSRRDGMTVDYTLARRSNEPVSSHISWRIGDARPRASPGTLEHFLTERYALYTTDRRGRILCGRIHHQPWRLHDTVVEDIDDDLVRTAGIDIDPHVMKEPLAFAAQPLTAEAWPLKGVT